MFNVYIFVLFCCCLIGEGRAKSDWCTEKHSRHFCRLCDEKIQIISQATTLYHGTAADAVTNITEEGLRLSSIGHLGPGIYFVDTLDKAMKIAQGKHHNNWAVLPYL